MKPRALIVGYGSIGSRHAEVLDGLGFDVSVASRRGDGGGRHVHASIAAALADGPFDLAVVANETAGHAEATEQLAAGGHHGAVLIEKPLFAAISPLPEHRFRVAGVGYNLRFHPVVRALRAALAGRSVQMAAFVVGQWLGDWRPGRDLATSYSSLRQAGGGALRDLSHELDLATWLLGSWRQVAALGGRLGSVTVDADDAWGILLACERCPVVAIQLDCLDRTARRTITIQADGDSWHADLIAGTLRCGPEVQTFSIDRNQTFSAMHRSLLEGGEGICTFDEGLRVVALIDAIERAAARRTWIERVAA